MTEIHYCGTVELHLKVIIIVEIITFIHILTDICDMICCFLHKIILYMVKNIL